MEKDERIEFRKGGKRKMKLNKYPCRASVCTLYRTSNVCVLFRHVNVAEMLKEESNQAAVTAVAVVLVASGKENEEKLGASESNNSTLCSY